MFDSMKIPNTDDIALPLSRSLSLSLYYYLCDNEIRNAEQVLRGGGGSGEGGTGGRAAGGEAGGGEQRARSISAMALHAKFFEPSRKLSKAS